MMTAGGSSTASSEFKPKSSGMIQQSMWQACATPSARIARSLKAVVTGAFGLYCGHMRFPGADRFKKRHRREIGMGNHKTPITVWVSEIRRPSRVLVIRSDRSCSRTKKQGPWYTVLKNLEVGEIMVPYGQDASPFYGCGRATRSPFPAQEGVSWPQLRSSR